MALDEAEIILTGFARSQLKAWLKRYEPRLNKRRKLIARRASKTCRVKFDLELDKPDSDTQGYMYYSNPLVVYVATKPEMNFAELVDHELAHFIAMLRWRYGGHGRRFTISLNQLTQEGIA